MNDARAIRLWVLFFSLVLTGFLASPCLAISKFSFAVFGDNRDGDAIFKKVIQNIRRDPEIAFVVSLGDFVSSGREDQYQHYKQIIKNLRVNIYHTIGNHELPNGGEERFKKYFGSPYRDWHFQNCHFITLDNVSQYGLGKTQENWLQAKLNHHSQDHLFIFMHKPMYDATGQMKHYVMGPASFVNTLHRWFQKHSARAVFAGHIHGYGRKKIDGIEYIVSGGAGAPLYLAKDRGGFHHYMKVTVDGKKVSYRVINIE